MIELLTISICLLFGTLNAANNYRLKGQVIPVDVSNYNEPLTNSILEIKIEDVSLQDTSSVLISQQIIRLGSGQKFPVRFEILCPTYVIDSNAPRYFYSISARITDASTNDLLYITDERILLPTVSEVENEIIITVALVRAFVPDKNLCNLKPDSGNCLAYIPKYYYDPTTKSCKEFIYGGCGGNLNRFDTKKDCEAKCAPRDNNDAIDIKKVDVCKLDPEVGPCKAMIQRYFYNATTNMCDKFNYGGCFGNPNNFINEETCLNICRV